MSSYQEQLGIIIKQNRGHICITGCEFSNNYDVAIEIKRAASIKIANSNISGNKYPGDFLSNRSICELQSSLLEMSNCTLTGNLNCENVI